MSSFCYSHFFSKNVSLFVILNSQNFNNKLLVLNNWARCSCFFFFFFFFFFFYLHFQQQAYIYVCGDAKYMAHDVHTTLLNIAQCEGRLSQSDAVMFFQKLEQESRYQKDVWVVWKYAVIALTWWQNQQNGMCAQLRLRSAWASAQADQSLLCPHEERLGPQLSIECTAKTLIRLGGCPGWSESSLSAHAILLVLSWGSRLWRLCDNIVSAYGNGYS